MTDKQIEKLYKKIPELVDSRQEILIDDKIKIRFLHSPDNIVEFTFEDGVERVSLEEFQNIQRELEEQPTSDLNFQTIKKNRIYDRIETIGNISDALFVTLQFFLLGVPVSTCCKISSCYSSLHPEKMNLVMTCTITGFVS